MKFEQTHWLRTDIQVKVRDGRVYDFNGINLGSVADLKQHGLELIEKVKHFYMIRKIGTDRYYCGGGNWCSQRVGLIWWDDHVHKIFERICEHCACELVKFEYEEKP